MQGWGGSLYVEHSTATMHIVPARLPLTLIWKIRCFSVNKLGSAPPPLQMTSKWCHLGTLAQWPVYLVMTLMQVEAIGKTLTRLTKPPTGL